MDKRKPVFWCSGFDIAIIGINNDMYCMSSAADSHRLLEELASRGYVVFIRLVQIVVGFFAKYMPPSEQIMPRRCDSRYTMQSPLLAQNRLNL